MTTLKTTIRPNDAWLELALQGALNGRSEEQYLSDYIDGLSRCLLSDARYYRSLGPWWPSLKTLLLEAGNSSIGTQIDEDIAHTYQYDRPALITVAATLYQQMRMSAGLLFSSNHLLVVSEDIDDEPYEFTSYDLELGEQSNQAD